MTLIKWKPAVSNFPTGLSNYFDTFFNDDFFRTPAAFTLPSVNVVENDNEYRLEVAVPGFGKDDFAIDVDNHLLTISGEKKNETKEEKENYTRREFSYSNFKRSFTLPETVNGENISAAYENGILNVQLPKKMESKKETKKTIKIS
jgi:HSP20 family protein